MKNTLTKIATAVSVAAIAGNAPAGTITSSISLNELLSNGASYSGSFALSPLLAANGLEGGTFNSATITAYGFSDTQVNQYVNAGHNEQYQGGYSTSVVIGSYSYSCGSWLHSRTCYSNYYGYAQYNTINAYDNYESRDTVADTMRLSSGSASASDTVDHTRTQTSGYNYNGSGSRNNGTYGYDTVYYYSSQTTDAWSGSLFAELGLGANDLLKLAQTGQFDFLVQATVGNFRLQGLSMTVDVAPAVASADVPEPASSLLVLGGLAGIAAAARRQRRQQRGQQS